MSDNQSNNVEAWLLARANARANNTMTYDLKDRVEKFLCLELPGQPMGMHMGTFYLVQDLWKEVKERRADVARLQDIVQGREAIDKLNTDQMQRDTKLIKRLGVDVMLLREALIGLEDATSNIPGHHGPSVWHALEDARQALGEKT